MLKNAYILHGVCDEHEYFEMDFPSPSNAHWLPWLQQKFLRNNTLCQCLEMPTPYKPNYKAWKTIWGQADLTKETIVIGHSAGCGFILKWLSENPEVSLEKLVLVAPFIDPDKKYDDFLSCNLDPNLESRVDALHVFYSEDEPVMGVKRTVDLILETYSKANYHHFKKHGHFCLEDTGSEEFPELWSLAAG